MLYSLNITYNKEKKNSYKTLLSKKDKSKIVILDIYAIKGCWYIDIRDEEKELHMGQKINSYEDLFEICKRRYRDFPELKLMALPINTNGFDVDFDTNTAGILQDLMVVENEKELDFMGQICKSYFYFEK